MEADRATISNKYGGGYLLIFGDGERLPLDEPEDIVALAEAMGCGPDMTGMNDREAEAYARCRIDGAMHHGDTVSRKSIENVC